MPSPAVYRGWAREYLTRAQAAPTRNRKLKFLQLAICSTVKAQKIEAEDKIFCAELNLRRAAE
jgi:hypothetical protein